ncbi:MAG: 16S rRNA (guanine1516-N2)-methyltransferase [Candidatus Latescibacterota bacterium]
MANFYIDLHLFVEWRQSLHEQKSHHNANLLPPALTIAVTHSITAQLPQCTEAEDIARALGCPYWPRSEGSLEDFAAAHTLDVLVVVGRHDIALWAHGHYLRYHPNAAALRIINLTHGRGDTLNELMQLEPGDRVLDCTCGLGADAISAAHSVGQRGHVLALEASPLLALLVRRGMATYQHPTTAAITLAMRRVYIKNERYQDLLPSLADHSFDIVYFDPMFSQTIDLANGLDLVRSFAQAGGPSPGDIQQARRVARRYVIMKDRMPGRALSELGFSLVKKSRRFGYGLIDCTTQ